MEQAPAGKPDENSFLTLLRAEIDKALPKNNSEAKDFIDDGQKAEIHKNVGGNISQQKDAAAAGVQGAAKEPPNPAGVEVKQSTPIPGEPPVPAPSVDGAGAMPAPKTDADISLDESKKSADQQMAENKVTPTQLKKANDPRFSAVIEAKSAVETQANTAPRQYRASERGILTQAATKANADARNGSAAMAGIKIGAGAKVTARQSAAKLREEQRRQEFTNKVEGIYARTKSAVEAKLGSMETDVMRDFDTGIDNALGNMKASAQREIDAFYDDRYSGALGWTDWIADKFKDTPQEVKDIIQRARARFTTQMDGLVVRIAATVEKRLKEAKDLIAGGQAEVKEEAAKLPANLREFGQKAEQEMAGRFDEMRQGVEDRKNALAQKLAEKYKEANDKADAAAKKMEEENAGLFNKFAKFLGEIVQIIREFKAKLMALLRKAADLIMDILADPIGFLGNLLGAIKQGVGQFVSNIWTHLKRGFMEWLFGSLASAGIEIPADLTLPSILKLVLGILGLTYDRMRAKAVKLIGERNVKILEKLYEYVKTLITEGPAALWAKVKDDLSNLKEMVIDAIQSWLIETVVKQAVIKLLSFFNPAGAFVQACIAIYNTVMFLVERASQIMEFVEAVINSVSMIVAGNISAAATWIENSLGKMIPLLIGFLARLIGLGGITDKIKEIIHKVQSFVDKAIDKVLAKIVAVVKKLFGKGGKEGGKAENLPPDTKQRWTDGMKEVRSLATKARHMPAGQGEVNKEAQAIKTRFGFVEVSAVHTGKEWKIRAVMNPEETITVKDDDDVDIKFVVVRVGSEKVTIKTEPATEEVELRQKMSALKKEQDLVKGLDMSPSVAKQVLKALGGDWHVGRMLLSFAREKGAVPPAEFVERSLRSQRSAMAAVEKPVGSDTRRKLVFLGEEKAPLSEFALVFYEQEPGQFKATVHPEAGMIEYNFLENGARGTASVMPLCTVRVNSKATVVRNSECRYEGSYVTQVEEQCSPP